MPSLLRLCTAAVVLAGAAWVPGPRPASSLPPTTRISTGLFHSCVLTPAGGAHCFGRGREGQLGDGRLTQSPTPVAVAGLTSGGAAVSAGGTVLPPARANAMPGWLGLGHTCAVTGAGGVRCWGDGGYGQLGNGRLAPSAVPVDVAGLTRGVVAVSTGGMHTCALTSGGRVKCWGRGLEGQLGDGRLVQSPTPVDVVGLSGIVAVSAGGFHTCALTGGGGVKCWGAGIDGRLGNGKLFKSPTPVDVSGLTAGAVAVAAGGSHSCAVTSSGKVRCWGRGTEGQLGDGRLIQSPTPVDVAGLSGIAAVATGGLHTCALTKAGAAYCWGRGLEGQLGDGKLYNRPSPVAVSGLASGALAVSAGALHACAVTSAGGARCWGRGAEGQLGNGRLVQSPIPVDVQGLSGGSTTRADFRLEVTPPAVVVRKGTHALYRVVVVPANGFGDAVRLSTGTLPPYTSATFSPATLTKTGATLVVETEATPPGTYRLTITGTRHATPTLSHAATVTLTVTAAASVDRTPPVVKAFPSSGKAGTTVSLRFDVRDDSGKARRMITIYRTGTKIFEATTSLSAAAGTYEASWAAPPGITGSLRFCIQATDAAGNTSAASCAPITLTSAGAGSDFSLVIVSPVSVTATRGATVQFIVSIAPLRGFAGTVLLSAANPPPRATVRFTPGSAVKPPGEAVLVIGTTTGTPPGVYELTIVGASGSQMVPEGRITHTARVTVEVR